MRDPENARHADERHGTSPGGCADRDRDISGVIVARSVSENLRYAASVVPNIHLFEYEVEFHLQPVHELTSAAVPLNLE